MALPRVPPQLSTKETASRNITISKERASWIKTTAKERAVSKLPVPDAQRAALSRGVDCAVSASFISPTGTNELPSSPVPPALDQQDLGNLLEILPCQLTEGNFTTLQRICQDCENTLGDNNGPIVNAPELATTGLVNEPAHCSSYLILAPPNARADHSCNPMMVSGFKEFVSQGWEVSFIWRYYTYYFIREPTASHDCKAPALQCSFTIISAFAEFQSQGWTIKSLDGSTNW